MAWTPNAKLSQPDDDATIWRYMDLPKFLSLIEQRALYFALPHQLEDTWEARIHTRDRRIGSLPAHIPMAAYPTGRVRSFERTFCQ